MIKPITISKAKPTQPAEDYEFLREEGLKYIEQLGSDLWTDYNSHDPGITILEILCYAITDLGNRTSNPIENLLASEESNLENMHAQFLSAAKILPSSPITENDYRKLLIDIPAVKNAWLSKAKVNYLVDCKDSKIVKKLENKTHPTKEIELNGLYDIRLELDENLTKTQITNVKNQVRAVYHQNRNLCEDLENISIVPQQPIMICADLDLANDADIEAVNAQILFDLEQYLTPNIKRYSVNDLLKKGKSPEEIFEGTLLKNGFIDDDELENSKLRSQVFVSDVMRVIMDIKGVQAIRKIFLNYTNPADRPSKEEIEKQGYKWCLKIKDGHQPVLDLTKSIISNATTNIITEANSPKSIFNFFKDNIPFVPQKEERDKILLELHEIENEQLIAVSKTELDLPMPLGKFRNLENYTSIQNDFPQTYGISHAGLPSEATEKRKIQAQQLKGYLLFFDQILANYFSQLANIPNLLSPTNEGRKTFFTQKIKDVRGIENLFFNYDNLEETLSKVVGERNDSENSDLFTKRKNRLLDHLLARFGESFNDYVILMHRLFKRKRTDRELIRDKIDFIKEYQTISKNRASGFDFCNQFVEDENGNQIENKLWFSQSDINIPTQQINVSGIVHRAARLAGISNYKRRNLSHIEYDIYQEKDDDNESELRWRVIDTDNEKILLSGSLHYENKNAAIEEMKQSIELGMSLQNYQLLETIDNRFYFNIIDSTGEVVGRRIEYFNSSNERMDAIEYLIDFLNEKFSEEGFYVIEHSLLRPRKSTDNFMAVCTEADCSICEPLDPYSFRVSIIFPGYTPRFSNLDFRKYMEKLIRMELPAHVLARICWVGEGQMGSVEKHYRKWLEYNQNHYNKPRLKNKSLNELLEVLSQLYTVYPPGTLHDCEEGDDENPIVLGRTHIGNQEEIIRSNEDD
ncbi:MAG: hypothetical protein AB8H03_03740 [Saprospiraceae bacterium]